MGELAGGVLGDAVASTAGQSASGVGDGERATCKTSSGIDIDIDIDDDWEDNSTLPLLGD